MSQVDIGFHKPKRCQGFVIIAKLLSEVGIHKYCGRLIVRTLTDRNLIVRETSTHYERRDDSGNSRAMRTGSSAHCDG